MSDGREKRNPTSPPDQAERDKIRDRLDSNILVEAAAGTGKTTSMVGRMVELVARGACPVDRIAAVTFTRKAAAELRARFQEGIERAASPESGRDETERARLAEGLARVELAFIGTIHSFCGRLLRERPVEAEVDVDFREIDEEEDLLIRREAWDLFVARLFAGDGGEDADGGESADGEENAYGTGFDALRKELEAVLLEPSDLAEGFLTFADYPDVDEWPTSDAELPPLETAARRLDEYARHMAALVPDFGRPGTDRLMPLYEKIVRMVAQNDLSRPGDVYEILDACRPSVKITLKYWPDKETAKAERERWRDFVDTVAVPWCEHFREARYRPALLAFLKARTIYDRLRRDRGVLNFQDLLLRAAALLRSHPEVRAYFADRFSRLLVDEFQDTDPIQAEVVLLLTAMETDETDWRRCTPRRGSLFVVGDPKQSIYRFRRADIETYADVRERIERSGGEVASLTANFRTVRPLQEWVNGVFADPEVFPAESDRFAPGYVPLERGRTDGTPGPELEGIGVIHVPPELKTKELVRGWEPETIARIIRHHVDRGTPVPRTEREAAQGIGPAVGYGDFLIVTWKKEALSLYGRALQKLGIPHRVTGGHAMNEVSEIELLRKTLAAVIRPDDPVALVALLRSGLFGFSDADLYAFRRAGGRFSYSAEIPAKLGEGGRDERERAAFFRETFNRLKGYAGWLLRFPPVPAIEKIAIHLGLFARAAAGEDGNDLAGGLAKAIEIVRAGGEASWSVADALGALDRIAALEKEYDGQPARVSSEPVVRVMNLHKVKGLEAPVTFLADPCAGARSRDATIHVNRSEGAVHGYLPVTKRTGEFGSSPIATPPGWEEHNGVEKRFLDAERIRLLYVAATRAGTHLLIVKNPKKGASPWAFFDSRLDDATPVEDPGGPEALLRPSVPLDPDALSGTVREIAGRWARARAPTCALVTAKEAGRPAAAGRAVAGGVSDLPVPPAEQAAGWGTVIHTLIEARLGDRTSDLTPIAVAACDDAEIDGRYVKSALFLVDRVVRSDLWKRALAGTPCLAETPIQLLLPANDPRAAELPTVLRGTVDLLFREEEGWVVVDWKTDRTAGRDLAEVAGRYRHQLDNYADAVERSTGEKVIERGIYLVDADAYVAVAGTAGDRDAPESEADR